MILTLYSPTMPGQSVWGHAVARNVHSNTRIECKNLEGNALSACWNEQCVQLRAPIKSWLADWNKCARTECAVSRCTPLSLQSRCTVWISGVVNCPSAAPVERLSFFFLFPVCKVSLWAGNHKFSSSVMSGSFESMFGVCGDHENRIC